MSIRRPLAGMLLGGALLGGAGLAVIGGLTLQGPGLISVGLAATLAGCIAAGVVGETPAHVRGSAIEAAVWVAGWSMASALVVAGVSTVAGVVVAVLVVMAGAIAFGVTVLLRARARRTATGASRQDRGRPLGDVRRLPVPPHPSALPGHAGPSPLLLPVTGLSTRALGEDWLRTTAALAGHLAPSAREALVTRREEALDELERRDPDGFGRWLAAGPVRGVDPADFVRGGPARQGPVPDTDAA